MVNTVCAIRFRGTINSIIRQVWRLVAVIIGLLMGLGYMILLCVGAYTVGIYENEIDAGYLLSYVGIVLFLFCVMVPMMFQHMLDPALDPRQYAPIISPSRKLSFALFAAMGVGPFGLTWLAFATIPVTLLWIGAGKPLFALCAFIAGFIQYVMGVLFVRLASAVFGQSMTRNAEKGSWKAIIAVIVYIAFFVAIGSIGPLVQNYFTFEQIVFGGKVLSTLGLSGTLVWPTLIAQGSWISLMINIVVTILVFIAAFEWWHRFATEAMLQGKAQKIDSQQNDLIAAAASGQRNHYGGLENSRPSVPVALPLIDRLTAFGLSEQTSAIIARIFVYTHKDVRITGQAIMTPLFLTCAFVFKMVGTDSFLSWEFIVFAGVFGGFTLFNSISLDGKAVWMHVGSPLSTRDDLLARLIAHSVIPSVTIVVCGPLFALLFTHPHAWFVIPTVLLAVFMCSSAVSLLGMSRWATPQAKAGKLTMKGAGVGMSGVVIGRIFLTFVLIALAMIVPSIALVFAYNTLETLPAVLVSLAVLAYSGLIIYISFRNACKKLKENYPQLLETIRTYP